MTKKIFDILPPNRIEGHGSSSTRPKKKNKPSSSGWSFHWWQLVIAILVIMIGGAFIYQTGWSSVQLVVHPQQQDLTLDKRVSINVDNKEVSLENVSLPGTLVTQTIEKSRQFKAQGQKKKKAHGEIIVYNSVQPTRPINLIAQTRFLSNSGYYFISPSPIHIPAAQIQNGELVPGSTKVEVEAMEGGAEYNIKPAQFSVPGLSGTVYYDKIYAVSQKKMTGGGTVTQVTTEDLDRAHKELLGELTTEGLKQFRKNYQGYVFLRSGSRSEVIKSSSAVEVGAEIEYFEFTINEELSAIGFKKTDLEQLAEDFVQQALASDRKLVPESLDLNYYVSSKDVPAGTMVIEVKLKAKTYTPFQEAEIKNAIQGQSLATILKTVQQVYPSVQKVEIQKNPFWLRSVPNSSARVDLRTAF